jgi:hypothetical protein
MGVLERIGDSPACRVLDSQAGGDREGWLTKRSRAWRTRPSWLRGD